MIKPNELRIGSWVNDHLYGNFKIVGLVITESGNQTVFKTLDYYPQSQYINKLKPIPLTEEILLKIGFIKYNTKDINPTYANKFFNWNNGILYLIGFGFVNRIKYLHQLQNIHFDLTGEELEINI